MGEFHLFWSQWVEFEKDCTMNGKQGFQGPGMENCAQRGWKGGNPLPFLTVKHLETLEVLLDHSGLFNTQLTLKQCGGGVMSTLPCITFDSPQT